MHTAESLALDFLAGRGERALIQPAISALLGPFINGALLLKGIHDTNNVISNIEAIAGAAFLEFKNSIPKPVQRILGIQNLQIDFTLKRASLTLSALTFQIDPADDLRHFRSFLENFTQFDLVSARRDILDFLTSLDKYVDVTF